MICCDTVRAAIADNHGTCLSYLHNGGHHIGIHDIYDVRSAGMVNYICKVGRGGITSGLVDYYIKVGAVESLDAAVSIRGVGALESEIKTALKIDADALRILLRYSPTICAGVFAHAVRHGNIHTRLVCVEMGIFDSLRVERNLLLEFVNATDSSVLFYDLPDRCIFGKHCFAKSCAKKNRGSLCTQHEQTCADLLVDFCCRDMIDLILRFV